MNEIKQSLLEKIKTEQAKFHLSRHPYSRRTGHPDEGKVLHPDVKDPIAGYTKIPTKFAEKELCEIFKKAEETQYLTILKQNTLNCNTFDEIAEKIDIQECYIYTPRYLRGKISQLENKCRFYQLNNKIIEIQSLPKNVLYIGESSKINVKCTSPKIDLSNNKIRIISYFEIIKILMTNQIYLFKIEIEQT